MPGGIEKEVLRLEVSVDDAPAVEELEHAHDLPGVEPGRGVVEPACTARRKHVRGWGGGSGRCLGMAWPRFVGVVVPALATAPAL